MRNEGSATKWNVLVLTAWMGLIFLASSTPGDAFPKIDSWLLEKFIHLVFYAALCFLVWRLAHDQRKFPRVARHALAIAFAVAVVFGASDEFHQRYTDKRTASVMDVLIDAGGAGIFAAARFILAKKDKIRSEV